MKKIILLSFSSLVLITSCKKQDAVQPNPTVEVSTIGSEQKTEVESFLTTYYTAKTNVLVDKADASSVSSFYSDNSAAYKCVQAVDRVRLVRKNKGLTYNVTNHSVTLNNIEVLSENTFKCTVNENVKYSITGLNVNPEEENLFNVIVEKRNGSYFIQKETDVELEAMQNYQDPSVVDAEEMTTAESGDFSKAAYNRSYAVWYAHEWWNRKNPSYYYFGHEGGNCTSFVNQSLKFGGLSDVSGASSNAKSWWYKSNGAGAYPSFARSWPSAHYFYVFLSKSTTRATASKYRNLQQGDIVQYKYAGRTTIGHSMLVTATWVDGNNEPFIWVTYHSVGEPWDTGKKDRLLDEMPAWNDAAVTTYYWKIK